jgi:subtilisin family serine protease
MRCDANWRITTRRAALVLALIVAPTIAWLTAPAVHAQAGIRTLSVNVGPSRTPLSVVRAPTVNPVLPSARLSPNLSPSCRRDGDNGCFEQASGKGGGGGGKAASKAKESGARPNVTQAAANLRVIANELVAEIDGTLTDAQADELARRHRLARVASQSFPLLGTTIGLFRVTDRRAVETVSRELSADTGVRAVQPNFRYVLQQQKLPSIEGDPAQYALAKLRLPEAHTLVRGANVTIAVIDSGIDATHPELANSIADTFDALGSKEGPHPHGTGIAGVIAAHARLMGAAPEVRILAIRAFGAVAHGAESNSYVILKSLDYAALHGAQIVNMSFAGPKDAVIARAIAATAARGIVMVAAAGNSGAKSPPLYPAAEPNVIAVSATDAQDRLITASNRGGYVAIAAPGADIFVPAPYGEYQMMSGTSFSAAYVSGIAALMLARNSELQPDQLRSLLMKTARDLGSPGRDNLFGSGEADAFAAVQGAGAASPAPVAAAPVPQKAESGAESKEIPPVRALSPPIATMASEKSGTKDGK